MKLKLPGYILVLSLMMVATLMILITGIVNQVLVSRRTLSFERDRLQAQALALSGIQIAYAQLNQPRELKLEENKPVQKIEGAQLWAINLTEYSSWWQRYQCTVERDGVDGTIDICIVPEAGKINLNSLYDFKEKKFVVAGNFDGRKILLAVAERLKPFLKNVNLIDLLEKFFKERKEPLEDITVLKEIKELEPLSNNFFPQHRDDSSAPFVPSFVDIFTIARKDKEINPALLSQSMQFIVGSSPASDAAIKTIRAELAPKIKENVQLPLLWDQLQPLLKKNAKDILPELQALATTKFEGNYVSVVSYGRIGALIQRVYAIIERKITQDKRVEYVIRKLYWL